MNQYTMDFIQTSTQTSKHKPKIHRMWKVFYAKQPTPDQISVEFKENSGKYVITFDINVAQHIIDIC